MSDGFCKWIKIDWQEYIENIHDDNYRYIIDQDTNKGNYYKRIDCKYVFKKKELPNA